MSSLALPSGPALILPSPVVELRDDRLGRRGIRLVLKRDDLIHPDLPGNKWRKLRLNVEAARAAGHRVLLTFGGAYSNHIRAVAAAGDLFGFDTVGVIRGEEHLPLNQVLTAATGWGMSLTYLDRATYRHKYGPDVIDRLRDRFGDFYLIPEGGSNELGVRGCVDLGAEITHQVPDANIVCCPVGTGGTLAGLAGGLAPGARAVGIAVLKGAGFLVDDVTDLQRRTFGAPTGNWTIELDFHFGGYAKRPADLETFRTSFAETHGLTLEPIYVTKMLAALSTLADQARLPEGSTVVAIVTG